MTLQKRLENTINIACAGDDEAIRVLMNVNPIEITEKPKIGERRQFGHKRQWQGLRQGPPEKGEEGDVKRGNRRQRQ
jgi:hypothetical protein